MENGQMINIIFEDNHILVVEKPLNIPVQEDSSKDDDLLSILKKYLKLILKRISYKFRSWVVILCGLIQIPSIRC